MNVPLFEINEKMLIFHQYYILERTFDVFRWERTRIGQYGQIIHFKITDPHKVDLNREKLSMIFCKRKSDTTLNITYYLLKEYEHCDWFNEMVHSQPHLNTFWACFK